MNKNTKDTKRLLALSLIVELMRCASDAYFGTKNFSSSSDFTLLCISIAIGELEGRPMSASKISEFIGMPRSSAIRKLAELQALGVIERPTQRSYVLSSAAMRRIEQINSVAMLLKNIRRVSTELAKLDS